MENNKGMKWKESKTQHNLTGNITCINVNPDTLPKKLRLPIQNVNILRFKITYFERVIQNQENVKNHREFN